MQDEQRNEGKSSGVGKRTYTVEEIQIMLGCGRIAVYELLKKKEFNWIRIGGSKGPYRISKASFDEWLDKQTD